MTYCLIFRSLLGDMKVLKEEPREQFFTPIVPMSEQRSYQTRGEFESRDSGQEFRQKRRPFDRRESFGDFDGQSVSQSMLERRPPRQQSMFAGREQHNLFAGESIGIFEADMKEATDAPKLQIWDRLMNDELQESVAQTPRNMFEEMIQWTEEGKLWRFPINNEQGMCLFTHILY
jgi:small subunit ribosomal protein S31